MATVRSYSSDGIVGSTTALAIPKPAGLVVGDLLVFIYAVNRAEGANADENLPTWTKIYGVTGLSDDDAILEAYYKIADASDVAASTYTVQCRSGSSAAGHVGVMLAIYDHEPLSVPFGSAQYVLNDSTPSFAVSQTPTVGNSILIGAFISVLSSTVTVGAASNYAIATDNITWTEIFDNYSELGNNMIVGVAYGKRPQTTATGNFSVVTDATTTTAPDSTGGLIVITPYVVDVTITGSTGVLSLVGNAGTIIGDANVTGSTGVLTLSGNAGVVTTPEPLWTNVEKIAAPSWTNIEKT